MSALVPISLIGWIVVAMGLFSLTTPRRAVLASFLLAWLFLPSAQVDLPGLPALTKITATSIGALLGVLVFDPLQLEKFRPHWVDIPIVAWCVAPMLSAIDNSHGVYDGASGMLEQVFVWGIPYFIGRLYFTTPAALRDLAIAVLIGGALYIPFCLYEIRMSPQLHRMVYGFHPSHFAMSIRYSGYRPMVFMQHGLMLGLWMTSACVVGVWLWFTNSVRRVWVVPVAILVPALLLTTILCKSTGALVLLIGAVGLLFLNHRIRSKILLSAFLAITPVYMIARVQGLYSGDDLVELARQINSQRADSLEGRLRNEDMLTARAMEKRWFGWGAWDDWRIFDEDGNDITVSDGMWVITMGQNGLFGLTAYTLVMLLPPVLFLWRIKPARWSRRMHGPGAALAVVLVLYGMDNLLNAMLNPIYGLIGGALSGFFVAYPALRRKAAIFAVSSIAQRRAAVTAHLASQSQEFAGER